MKPFDFVNAINTTKEKLINSEETEKAYNPHIVNRALSYFPDTIFYAQEMNMSRHLDNKLQFDYLINSIRKAKRFSKWAKKEENSDVEVICEYYGYSPDKAKAALSILSSDQLKIIRRRLEKGGSK